MATKKKLHDHLVGIAEQTLKIFRDVASTAIEALKSGKAPGPEVFASTNTFTGFAATRNLDGIQSANRAAYATLSIEPAVARVVVTTDDDRQMTFYICRAMPIGGMASLKSPVGRLASLEIGETYDTKSALGKVTLNEKATLHPNKSDGGWDSWNSALEGEDYGPLTVESMRAYFRRAPEPTVDAELLDKLLKDEREKVNVFQGLRRAVITKIGLRDQPVLDRFQDEIFRLPLGSRLLLLGSPGTGKTTTLIRRLGQKIDVDFLDVQELAGIDGSDPGQRAGHSQSWLMFTPTELLKQYVKEAFAREQIPAPDTRITTWSDYRRDIARNTFPILRTTGAGGVFVLKDSVASLTTVAIGKSIDLFEEFDGWQKAEFLNRLRKSADELASDKSQRIAAIGRRLLETCDKTKADALGPMFISFQAEGAAIQGLVDDTKKETDTRIRGALNLQVNGDRDFLDKLAQYLDSIKDNQPEEEELDDQEVDDDEEDTPVPRTGRLAAQAAYIRAVRAQARAKALKRSVRANSRVGLVVKWLGTRGLAEADLPIVGENILLQAHALRFLNPVRRYIRGAAGRYRAFRRSHQEKSSWYNRRGFQPTDIHPLELDIVLLSILRLTDQLLRIPSIARSLESPAWSALRPAGEMKRNQILIDEVSDFSPTQIACMAALMNPRVNSFFAAGDFNQRLTSWGSRDRKELSWAVPNVSVKVVTISYRHTKELNEFSKALTRIFGTPDSESVLPKNVETKGVLPALLTNAAKPETVVTWLKARIEDIASFKDPLPSIGILVNEESEVTPLAQALDAALADLNIRVVPCPNGQVMGRDNDVRVFNVQHIKGLEFEAAFFVGIDRLAQMHPDLYDKYLYVGATRAATYLGITCVGNLPTDLEQLRSMFTNTWGL